MDRYSARINLHGKTQRERHLSLLKQSLTKNLPNSLSNKSVKINGEDQLIDVIKTNNEFIKTIHSLPNESFSTGDYVIHGNATYLITKVDLDDEIYTVGKMQYCNWTLKFQAPDGTILSYPCITSNKSFNQDENNIISLGSNEKSILLPYDDNTALLTTDRRMYVDKRANPTPYKVIGDVDTTSYNYGTKGLIYFVMKQDELGSPDIDRVDLGVCDYFEPTTTLPPVEGYSYSEIICSNPNNEITLGGSARTLTPTFYNADDTIAENITSVWTWVKPLGHDRDFTITYDGNLAKIKVAENYDLIGMEVTANVMGLNGGYGGEITLMITL